MTPAIGTGSTASAARSAQAAQPAQATQADASASARPLVQSRRMSLKLGPLGISYSTDRVLWTEAVAAAAAQTLGASEAKGAAALPGAVASVTNADTAGQDGVDGGQAQAKQAEATSRTFSLELAQAWRRQVEARERNTQIYGRSGSIRAGAAGEGGQTAGSAAASAATARRADPNIQTGTQAGTQTGTQAGTQATPSASPAAVTSTTEATAQAGPAAASTASSSATGGFATQQESAPASRMRQAIGAYLACARNFSAVPPMLTAVA